MRGPVAIGFALSLVLAMAGPCLAAPRIVRIGHHEVGKDGTPGRNWKPLETHLDQGGAFDYEIHAFRSDAALLEAFHKGELDLVLVGPINYVELHSELGAYPLVADGPKYLSVIVVRKDSPIRSLEELAGKRMAFAYKDSTSSYLYPLLMMSKARVKESDLAAADFVGSHRKVAEVVLNGKYDAGGVIKAVFDETKDQGLRELAVSEPIPGIPLVARKDLDPAIVADVRKRLLSFDAGSPTANVPFARGAVPVIDADYNQIRFLCRVVLGKDFR